MQKSSTLLLIPILLAGCAAQTSHQRLGVQEASGVARLGDDLLLVGDDDAGRYFRYPLPAGQGPLISIDPGRLHPVVWPQISLSLDQESIDLLADGRVAILSERLRALVGEEGIIAEYGGFVSESGNRGLEGLAVRELSGGASRVAVLWEGGYPVYKLVPPPLQKRIGRFPMNPVILIHDIDAGQSGLSYKKGGLLGVIEVELPKPQGSEPRAQRFRAPDLVWHKIPSGSEEEWGFILLLSSAYSLPPQAGSVEDCTGRQNLSNKPEKYCYKWLLRFDRGGNRVGAPLDLSTLLPVDLADKNWEGMDWFVEGRSLVLVHEEERENSAFAAIVELPLDW